MRLIFWNCGAPAARREPATHATAVVGMIRVLLAERPSIVALCEIDPELVAKLVSELALFDRGYRERVLYDTKPGAPWNLAVLFDQQQLSAREGHPVIAHCDGRVLRAGYPIELRPHDQDPSFNLYLAHWPSRLLHSETLNRTYCAQALWSAIEERLRENERVVVLGDFNDEPYDSTLCRDLRASRDPRVVQQYRDRRLYNPSWWLVAPTRDAPWDRFGTARYKKSGAGSQWHALDQALTCHQWLDPEQAWAPELRALHSVFHSTEQRRHFDHVPIELRLRR